MFQLHLHGMNSSRYFKVDFDAFTLLIGQPGLVRMA